MKDFFNFVGEGSFYGAKSEDTVDSLAVSILPTPDPDFKYVKLLKAAESNEDVAVKVASAMKDTEDASIVPVCQSSFVLLKELLNILHSHCGFRIGQVHTTHIHTCILDGYSCMVYNNIMYIPNL